MRNQLTYVNGLLAGISSFIVFILLYIFGMNPFGNISWIGAFIPVVFIVMATQKAKKEIYEGYISFKESFVIGAIVTLAWSLSFSILVYLFCQFIATEIIEIHIEDLIVNIEKLSQFLEEDTIDQMVIEMRKMTLFDAIQGDVINKVFGGLIVSLIVSAIVKKQRPMFE